MEAQQVVLGLKRNPSQTLLSGFPCNPICYKHWIHQFTISLYLFVLPLGAIVPDVAEARTQSNQMGIGIYPWALRVVVVTALILLPAPTVLGQVAKLLAVSAFWCTRTVMVEVLLGLRVLAPHTVSYINVPDCIKPDWFHNSASIFLIQFSELNSYLSSVFFKSDHVIA
ncbi:hypothetical protein Tco_0528393 [Tanacetum coccineum]